MLRDLLHYLSKFFSAGYGDLHLGDDAHALSEYEDLEDLEDLEDDL
jgi:hypothetical protein